MLESGGYELKLNEAGSEYDILLPVPEEESRWGSSSSSEEEGEEGSTGAGTNGAYHVGTDSKGNPVLAGGPVSDDDEEW